MGWYKALMISFWKKEIICQYTKKKKKSMEKQDILKEYKGNIAVYAENGEIVVALIEDEATVKTFYKEKDHIIPKYSCFGCTLPFIRHIPFNPNYIC